MVFLVLLVHVGTGINLKDSVVSIDEEVQMIRNRKQSKTNCFLLLFVSLLKRVFWGIIDVKSVGQAILSTPTDKLFFMVYIAPYTCMPYT